MATGLKNRPEEKEDRLNPGARIEEDRVERFDDYGQPKQEKANLSQQERDDFDDIANRDEFKDLRNLEKDPGSPVDKDSNSSPNEDNPWETNVKQQDTGGGKAKTRGGSFKKYGLIGGFAVGGIGGLIGLIFGVMNLAVVNWKEVSYESAFKRNYTKSAQRSAKTLRASLFASPDGCQGIRCKYSGATDEQIRKFERMGMEVDATPGQENPDKSRINSLTLDTGERLDASNFEQSFDNNPKVRQATARMGDVNGTYTRTTDALRAIYNKVGARRANFLADKQNPTRADMISALRERTLAGGNLTLRGRAGTSAEDAGNVAATSGLSQEIQDAAQEERQRLLDDPEATPDIVPDLDEAASIASGGARGAVSGLRVDGAVQIACDAYSLIRAVDVGAKVLVAIQLMRYAVTYASFADAIKAGEASPGQIAVIANMMFSENEDGKNFFDSSLFQYISYGTPPDPDTIAKYVTGASFAVIISQARQQINDFFPGNSAQATCRAVQSVGYQIAAAGASVLAAVFTGGGSIVGSLVAGAAAGVLLGVLEAYAIPLLVQMAAGTVATGDENGYDFGNATAAGLFVLSSTMGRSKGLMHAPKAQVAADQREVDELYNDMFPENRPSPVEKVAMNAAMFGLRVSRDLPTIAQPQTMIAQASKDFSMSQVYAVNEAAITDSCQDPDYVGYATTPSCALIHSKPTAQINDPKFAPEAVLDFMINGEYVDPETGEPFEVEEGNEDNPGFRYQNYRDICNDSTVPFIDDTVDGVETFGETVIEYCEENTDEKRFFNFYREDDGLVEDPEAVEELLEEGFPAAGGGVGGPLGPSPIPGNVRNNLVFTGDYNTNDWGQWELFGASPAEGYRQTPCQPSSAELDNGTLREPASVASARYSVGSVGGCGQRRAEVLQCDAACVREGDTRWYEFSVRYADDFQATHNGRWFIIMQWHSGSGSPPLAINIERNGDVVIGGDGANAEKKVIGKVQPGQWVDYALQVGFSRGGNGFVEGYENGVLTVPRFNRQTMSSGESYLKQGLYTDPAIGGTHTIWHDGLKVYAP